MNNEIVILKSQADIDAFRLEHPAPEGQTILNGDRGIGCFGKLGVKVRDIGSDPNVWVEIAGLIGPYIHAANEK